MRIESIPHYLRKRDGGNVIVQFSDGDRYPLSALDLWGENEEGEFEINVSFNDCLEPSRRQARAVKLGRKAGISECSWTSVPPVQPVGMLYGLADIEEIEDQDMGTCVYHRQAA